MWEIKMSENIENKVICLWKKIVKDNSTTSFDENYKIECRKCDGYKTKDECKNYYRR